MMSDHIRGEDYEQANVHDVYNKIAPHFSATRYKVGDCIEAVFSISLTASSHGL